MAFGHGRTGWYVPSKDAPGGEVLAAGSVETFTHEGCKLVLRIADNCSANEHLEMCSSFLYRFSLGDIDPQSIKISSYSHRGGFRCEDYEAAIRQDLNCDHAEIGFSTRSEAPLIDEESHAVFPNLQGKDHESHGKSKASRAFFEVDDLEYTKRFANALRHAVELCGGKPSSF